MKIARFFRATLLDPSKGLDAVGVLRRLACLSFINRFGRSAITAPSGPVVSLTTYGERFKTVYLVIESIGRGEITPSRVILWLDDEALYDKPPASIKRLKRRGLEVKLTRNYGPHTKYYPYIQSQEFFIEPLVTADDDMLYPRYWLKKLTEAFRENPAVVNCYRARRITLGENGIGPYHEWGLCASTEANVCHFGTGVSGIIYPPSLQRLLKQAGDEFRKCCPKADDVWLHVQALRAGYKVRQIEPEAVHFPMLPGTQEAGLFRRNVLHEDGNDQQVRKTYEQADIDILRQQSADPGVMR